MYFDWIAAAGICGCLIGAYIKIEYYQIMVKYMPLISVFVMAVFFFNHVNWIESLKIEIEIISCYCRYFYRVN